MSDKDLTHQCLFDLLQTLPITRRYWVGYSGGLDSHVLLHLLISIKDKIDPDISVVHIDHSLSHNSESWSEHCQQVCDRLDVKIHNIKIKATCPNGESIENWARQRRYAAISELIGKDDIFLTAHHREDQAETVLLQLMRGSGPRGLAGMPVIRQFDKGWLARPLLGFTRNQILDYAKRHHLRWIDDESNIDVSYDRNYLRQVALPVLEDRWPGLSRMVSRSAGHQSEIIGLLDEIAQSDLEHGISKGNDALDICVLKSLTNARIKNLIHYWLKKQHFPAPDSGHLKHILSDVIYSSMDSSPCLRWSGTEVRRYKTMMYAMEPLPIHDPGQRLRWDMAKSLKLASGVLAAKKHKGDGIAMEICQDGLVEVGFRQGGECLRLSGRKHRHELKKLFQEYGVLPWYRDRIPLLFIRDKLAAVAGLWIDEEFIAGMDQVSWQINWTGAKDVLSTTGTIQNK
ncbi:MAG: tRNA lysidine(34) synthetase TilS [Gammaproteobacteria bacterium]